MLYTSMGQEMLWVLIPFIWTKSLFMKLLIALESKSALTECTLLVSVVLISIGRIILLWSRAHFLFFHCIFQSH